MRAYMFICAEKDATGVLNIVLLLNTILFKLYNPLILFPAIFRAEIKDGICILTPSNQMLKS